MLPLVTSPAAASARTLHALLELLLAGPQYGESGTIRLRVLDRSVRTVAEPAVRIDASGVHGPRGDLPWTEVTTAALSAERIGVTAVRPGIYEDSAGVGPHDPLTADPAELAALLDWYALGAAGLELFAPGGNPVLWPEHADLALVLDEVNYGVSPGDANVPGPYAYVGPWQVPQHPFFTMPFGAVRRRSEIPDPDALARFFEQGRDAVRQGARPGS
jgi:hypothetical protein